MSPPQLIMDILEFLYDYKQFPALFFLHLLTLGLMGTYIVYLFWMKSWLQSLETNPRTEHSKCHDHMKYVDYLHEKKRTTEAEVNKLQSSKEYQDYMMKRNDPASKYNREIDVEEIVFSDDEDKTQINIARSERKNKTM